MPSCTVRKTADLLHVWETRDTRICAHLERDFWCHGKAVCDDRLLLSSSSFPHIQLDTAASCQEDLPVHLDWGASCQLSRWNTRTRTKIDGNGTQYYNWLRFSLLGSLDLLWFCYCSLVYFCCTFMFRSCCCCWVQHDSDALQRLIMELHIPLTFCCSHRIWSLILFGNFGHVIITTKKRYTLLIVISAEWTNN